MEYNKNTLYLLLYKNAHMKHIFYIMPLIISRKKMNLRKIKQCISILYFSVRFYFLILLGQRLESENKEVMLLFETIEASFVPYLRYHLTTYFLKFGKFDDVALYYD